MPDIKLFGYTNKEIAFLFIWLAILLIPMIYGITHVYKYEKSHSPSLPKACDDEKTSWENRIKIFLLPLIFSAIFISYAYLILYDAELVGNDYGQITLFTAQNKLFHMPIWERAGRFWPLGFQEFNFVSLFGKEPVIYFSLPVLQLLIVLLCLPIILWNLSLIQTVIVALLLIVSPSFVKVYFDLIYPERNVIFWLAIFVLSLQSWEKYRSRFGFCMTMIAAQFSLYYKEPVFVLLGSFSILRLVIAFLLERKEQRRIELRYFIRKQWINFSLLTFSLTFLLLYLAFVLPGIETSYNARRSLNTTELEVFLKYLQIDPFLSILILVFLVRVFFLKRKNRMINPFWDSLAFGSIMYFFAYVKLQICSLYYMAPVDFISILYVSWAVHRIIKLPRKGLVSLMTGVLVCGIFFNNLGFSSAYILNTKKAWDGRVHLSTFLKNYKPDKIADNIEIFFPLVRSYQLIQVAIFLDYKSVALYPKKFHRNSGILEQSNIPLKIIVFKGSSCGKRYICYETDELKSGNLIVIIPDRGRKVTEVLRYYETGFNLLFHYQPQFSGIENILLFLSNPRELIEQDIYVFVKD